MTRGDQSNGSGLTHSSALAEVPSPLLSVDNLWVSYGKAVALFGVSLDVLPGSVLAILGPNGAGKSTLVKTISGMVRPKTGEIVYDGVDLTRQTAHRIVRSGVALVPEGRCLFPHLSVRENLQVGMFYLVPKSERASALARVFDVFPVLHDRQRQRAGTLSGGEQQMLALARVVAAKPRLLLADEISLGLAPRFIDAIFTVLAEQRDLGMTIVLVEQYVQRALDIADRVCFMQHGRVTWSGMPAEVGNDLVVHYLGDTFAQGAGE